MHDRPRLTTPRPAGRRPGARVAAAAAGAGFLAVALGGCAGPVEATAPTSAASPGCAAAARHWPTTVGDATRRDTASDSPAVAAWGDPPVIARCGLSALTPTTEECLDVSGVDWVVRRLSDGAEFTTYGTDPAIEVLVPAEYAPEPLLLPAFGAAARALPSSGRSCR